MKFDEQTLFTSLADPSTVLPAFVEEDGKNPTEAQAVILGGSSNE
jgi:hypothetical protein